MTDAFWSVVCQAMPVVRVLLAFELVLAVLLVFSAPALSPGSPNYYVAGFAAVVIAVTTVGLSVVYWKCRRRVTR